MKNILQSIIVSFAMYSKIPMPRIEWTKENMRYAMSFFPLIGVVIGVLVYLANLLLLKTDINNVLRTAILILIPVVVSGGIHLDGLLDTADGISSYQDMEKRLEILKDSNSGAFAIITCVCYFILDFAVWYDIKLKCILLLTVSFVLSRALSGLAVVTFKCAKNSGLVHTFSDSAQKKNVAITMIIYIIACLGLLIWLDPLVGTLEFIIELLFYGYYRHMSYSKFGRITGDLAGFFVQMSELIMALWVVIAVTIFR
ncbi:cobalamin-5'-phosphate synthase [Acetitomaculum ruminis DSM 5522]|uniref:Adenosylcobinamide-GDP ribazoletransferase n=1 Tax=Acetitomaculum ruminis DSM 5522 TaxID=1120918 RepID=A0A1I0WXT0_9FIRM|nr:adenosylcobinamide-GDP ribazoletransferase [Acetitomaculum ruminis]SFA92703.1 cobalamin-5'-phosphate synthase [Acetitomaculum ruminis DSM 5522]